jgi:hypothetical protein
MKANNKTQPSKISVDEYIGALTDASRRCDAQLLLDLIKQSTNCQPVMWGTSIVGFGTHHYEHDSGRTGHIAAIGFSARKQALAVYGLRTEKNKPLINKMKLAQESKGCIYIKNVEQTDKTLLQEAITNAYLEREN